MKRRLSILVLQAVAAIYFVALGSGMAIGETAKASDRPNSQGQGNLHSEAHGHDAHGHDAHGHDAHGHDNHQSEGHHHHGTLEIPSGQPIPSVDLVVRPDAMKGWNLELRVSNFRFAPEKINQESNYEEGHAHLYIDGKKISRLYGPWYYLPHLEPGEHEITVTLNANGHEDFLWQGEAIADTVTIEVP
ncbi:MAG: hypothetical protein F6J93_36595 [Oscillatoria sp. SIO1A7]|nr:hypothetical protein [Oscillatoria sp. SIO1A7]